MKPMPALAFAGVIIPLILLFAAPLGLVYAGQRTRLLRRIDSAEPPDDPKVVEQINYIRERNRRLDVPIIVAGVYLVIVAGLVALALTWGSENGTGSFLWGQDERGLL